MPRRRCHVSVGLFFAVTSYILARYTQWFSSYCCKCVKWIFWTGRCGIL